MKGIPLLEARVSAEFIVFQGDDVVLEFLPAQVVDGGLRVGVGLNGERIWPGLSSFATWDDGHAVLTFSGEAAARFGLVLMEFDVENDAPQAFDAVYGLIEASGELPIFEGASLGADDSSFDL